MKDTIKRGDVLKSEKGGLFVVKRVIKKDDDLDRLVLVSFLHGVVLSGRYTTDDVKKGRLTYQAHIDDVAGWLRGFSSDHPQNRPTATLSAPAPRSRPTE